MINQETLMCQLSNLGIKQNDTVLIRADLAAIGRIQGGATTFITALLNVVGEGGTIISLAFTGSSFIRMPKLEDAFDINTKSYAGALPNRMLKYPNAKRSSHPMCSYVAIGKNADVITSGHDASSPAYEPIRKLIELGGKSVLVGCVQNSPGFTTAHLAEYDLNLFKLRIFPQLTRTYYKDLHGNYALFARKDAGLCSNSYYKFYSHYVNSGILNTAYIGNAYAILAPSKEAYEIEKEILSKNKKFNICDSKDCYICNSGRWDRIHMAPAFWMRKIIRKLLK